MQAIESVKVLDALAATGLGASTHNPMLVEDYDYLVVMIATASSYNGTVKAQGSILHDKPDFAAAQSVANPWDYVQLRDLEDASAIDGDTGFTAAGTDDFRIFKVNVDGLRWFALNQTARAAGAVTAWVKGFKVGHNV